MELGERVRYLLKQYRKDYDDYMDEHCPNPKTSVQIEKEFVQAIVKIVQEEPCNQPCESMIAQMEEIARLREEVKLWKDEYGKLLDDVHAPLKQREIYRGALESIVIQSSWRNMVDIARKALEGDIDEK